MAAASRRERRRQRKAAGSSARRPRPKGDPLAMARQALRAGDVGQAQRALTAALDSHPGWAEALALLAEASQDEAARDAYRTRLAAARTAAPEDPHIRLLAARDARRRGALAEARDILDSVLAAQPDWAEAEVELGYVRADDGDFENAVAVLRSAYRAGRAPAWVTQALGVVRARAGDPHSAIAAFTESLTHDPADMSTVFALANTHERVGDLASAEAVIDAGEARAGRSQVSELMRARLALRRGEIDRARAAIERFDWSQLRGDDAAGACFIAGEIYDRCGEVDAAMRAFTLANAKEQARPNAQQVNKRDFLAPLERAQARFTPAYVADWPRPTADDRARDPVFFVGFPRSGTTLLEVALDAHPGLSVLEERPTVSRLAQILAQSAYGYPDQLNHLTTDDITTLRHAYERARAPYLDGQAPGLVIDKLPINTGHLGMLYRIFPGMTVIFAVRHPADVVLSNFMQRYRPNSAMANFYSLADGAYCYDLIMRLWQCYRDLLAFPHITVPYEALIADFEGVTARVLDFLGVGWDDAVAGYRSRAQAGEGAISTPSHAQVSDALYSRARYRWQAYRDHMRDVMDPLLGWAAWHGYTHHPDGTITAPDVAVHGPAPTNRSGQQA